MTSRSNQSLPPEAPGQKDKGHRSDSEQSTSMLTKDWNKNKEIIEMETVEEWGENANIEEQKMKPVVQDQEPE